MLRSLTIIFIVFVPHFIFTQENQINDSLIQFNTQRNILADDVQAIRSLELEWRNQNFNIPALVQLNETHTVKQFNFFTYKTIQPNRIESIKNRLLTSYPEITSLTLNIDGNVRVDFNNAHQSTIDSFFKNLGYEGYIIR